MHDQPIPLGLCQCGCGQTTNLARQNAPKHGHVLGQPMRFLRGHSNTALEKNARHKDRRRAESHAKRAAELQRGQLPQPLPPRARELPAAFFAGFFDADGSVSLKGSAPHSMKVVVTQVDPFILFLYKERYGGFFGLRKRAGGRRDGHDWEWSTSTAMAESFLLDVFPYLVVKYERVKLALEYRELFKGINRIPTTGQDNPHNRPHIESVVRRRQECVARMRVLNMKGQKKSLP